MPGWNPNAYTKSIGDAERDSDAFGNAFADTIRVTEPVGNTDWELAVGGLRGVIAARPGNVLAQLP